MKHHRHLQQSPNGSQASPIYQPDLPLQVLFPAPLTGPNVPIHTPASINQNNRFGCSVCQSAPAPKAISVVQPSVCLAQLLLWADPVVSLRVPAEFIPCTSVRFGDFGKSPHACKKKKKKERKERKKRGAVTPCWMVPQNTRWEKKNNLAMGILACELKPHCQTQRQHSLCLLASFHVCFVSSYADIMRTALVPLVFTRVPLNLIQLCNKINK